MALELIGALVVAASLGLMAWALRRHFSAMPKWSVPVAAGVGLIGTTIWLEYDWFSRVSAELPAGFAVVNPEATSAPLRPWTYLAPIVTRFTAIDTTKIARHPARNDLIVAPVFGFARWQNPQSALMVFDCAGNRRTPIVEGTNIDEAGVLTGGEWVLLETKDELQETACREG
jgi:hypothetical protein